MKLNPLFLVFSTISIIGVLQIVNTNGANILFYIGMGSYSHRVPLQPLIDALTDKGHKVSFLSGFPPKVPNPKVEEVNPPKLTAWTTQLMDSDFDVFKFRKNSQILLAWTLLLQLGIEACDSLYSDPEFLKWHSTAKFDIVVMDSLANECAYGMAHHFKAKLVSFNTAIIYPWNYESYFGLPDESSSIPDGMTHVPVNMNIFHRTVTALIPLFWKILREYWFFPKLEQITKKGLNLEDFPSFVDIEANTSLAFLNSHWAQEYPRSLPPNVVSVGGLAGMGQRKPLPKNIENFINKGNDGFIYVSFGTVAEFTKFDPEIRQAFIEAIQKFPKIQFIWKSTYPIKEKLPSNILVEKWLPQVDILAHPKIKLFITHGGLGGIYEAILTKVPIICFPVFAEQEYNADLMVYKGYGVKLELTTLKEKELTDSIIKVTTNPNYKRQVEKVSKMFTDRPMDPLQTAVWWMEFVHRTDDPSEFLRPLSALQPWWKRRQLDVWALICSIVIAFLSIVFIIVRFILKRILRIVFSAKASTTKKVKEKRKVQ